MTKVKEAENRFEEFALIHRALMQLGDMLFGLFYFVLFCCLEFTTPAFGESVVKAIDGPTDVMIRLSYLTAIFGILLLVAKRSRPVGATFMMGTGRLGIYVSFITAIVLTYHSLSRLVLFMALCCAIVGIIPAAIWGALHSGEILSLQIFLVALVVSTFFAITGKVIFSKSLSPLARKTLGGIKGV